MATPDDAFLLGVDVLEGKGFGPEVQALKCVATFGGEAKETPYSVSKDAHVWSCSLQWRVTRQQLRKLSSVGQSNCKIVVKGREGDKALGWIVLDTRKAKINPIQSGHEGARCMGVPCGG